MASMTRSSAASGSSTAITRPSEPSNGKTQTLKKELISWYARYTTTRSQNDFSKAKKLATTLQKMDALEDKWYKIFGLRKYNTSASSGTSTSTSTTTSTTTSTPVSTSDSPTPAFQPSTDAQQSGATSAITTVTTQLPDGSQVEVPVVDEAALIEVPSSSSGFSKTPLLILGGIGALGLGFYFWSRRR